MGYSPTRITLILGLALVALSVFALTDASLVLPWAVACGGLCLVIAVDALFLPRQTQLGLHRGVPTEVGIGVPFTMTLALQNESPRPIHGAVFDLLPPSMEGLRVPLPYALSPDEQAEWSFELSATDRGAFTLDTATIVITGPLRLMRRIVRGSAPATVSVIPGVEILRSNELILKAARDADAGITRARGIGRGGEFDSLAPYVPGDPPQSVDWKAYARTGQLAVRRYVPERRRHIMLACDAGRLMGTRVGSTRKIDMALEAMTRVAAAALQRGDLVGMVIFDGEVQSFIPPRAGSGQLAKIVRASLNVKPRHTETAFTPAFVALNHALPRRALVILATDFDNEAQGWELQRNIAQITRRHVAIVAAMRDPVYHATVAAEVNDASDAYRQLASLTLLEERQMILSRIHSTGVHVIDAEPSELQGPLLNMYGSVVTGGRL
ncbi:MAG: DUF58 domain-containing protein [Planctomycetes bacterium]|nr:DUF58 domain-containing protein [Planctomycetota bacterium]